MYKKRIHLQTHNRFKSDTQKVDQHIGCKWLTHGTKNHKDNQLQSLELYCTSRESIHGIKAQTHFVDCPEQLP